MLRLDAGNLRGDLRESMLARLGKLADGGEEGGVEDPLQHLLSGDEGLQVGEVLLAPCGKLKVSASESPPCAVKRIWWSCSSTSAAWIWPSWVGGEAEQRGGASSRRWCRR